MLLNSALETIVGRPLNDLGSWSSEILSWAIHHPSILFMCMALAAAPAVFWGWMWYRKVEMDDDHRALMYRTFLFGMFAILPVYLINYATGHFFDFDLIEYIETQAAGKSWLLLLFGYMLIGVYEECSKFFIVKEVDFKKRAFNRIVDGIEFAIAAALGFAFMENMLYFISALQDASINSPKFTSIVIFRSLGSMLAHTLFSGVVGYYYGRAKFVGIPAAEHGESLSSFNLYRGMKIRATRLKSLAKGQKFHKSFALTFKQEELIAEGLFIGIVLHGIYNFLVSLNLTVLIVPIIVIEYAIIVHELHAQQNLVVHVT